MNIRSLFDSLSTRFSILKEKLILENSVNDQGLNTLLETTYIKILNEVYGYELVNSNLIHQNSVAVDAVDEKNRIYVQITSTFSKEKIEKTIKLINNHKLYEKYDTLLFCFLKGKKTLNNNSISQINKEIKGKFSIDFEKNLIDNNDIYQKIFYEQDIKKASKVLSIINKVLGLIPEGKDSGYESISVSFSNEIENAYRVVELILKEGINVYINSKELYKRFKNDNHRFFSFLILFENEIAINHVKHTIVILNDSYIVENLQSENRCKILQQALLNDNRIQVISFSTILDYSKISYPMFKNWKTVSIESLDKCLSKILQDLLDNQNFLIFDESYIKNELQRINNNFILFDLTKGENINYHLFQFTLSSFENIKMFYILLKPNYTLSSVISHFNSNYANLINKNLVILAPKDPLQKTRNRIEKIKKTFNNSNVEYIQDHFFDKTFKSVKQENILLIDDFIDPIIKDNDSQIIGINGLLNWVNTESSSRIAIINGQGGIGKTTLCKKLHDILLRDFKRYHIIFINSTVLLKEFSKLDFNDEKEYEIYNIYEIWCRSINRVNQEILDKNAFYINYFLGNILIIFDGIDEVISTIPNFNLSSFLINVAKIQENIGKGKIIINCRDTYIYEVFQQKNEKNNLSKIDKEAIEVFDLLPFNKELAENYFSKHFGKKQKINNALNLLDEFVIKDINNASEYIYPPFILEIVKKFVDKEFDESIKDFTFCSSILIESDVTDNISYKTCYREISKKETNGFDLEVDKQIEFMISLSIEKRGYIVDNEFADILRNIKLIDRLNDYAIGLRDHPFLILKENKYHLRFDFLNSYFKSLAIFKLIKQNAKIKEHVFKLLANDCNYNSQITKYLIQKIKINPDEYVELFKQLIEKIHQEDYPQEEKQKAICNLFLILQQSYKDNTPETNKNILKQLFSDKTDNSIIDKFYLIDVTETSKLIIDFSNLFFRDIVIKNYHAFFNCIFNQDTLFDDTCCIDEVYSNEIDFEKISAEKGNFGAYIKGDNTIVKVLNMKKSDDGLGTRKLIISSLKLFFKCFYDGQVMKGEKLKNEISVNYKLMNGPANIDKIIRVLEKNGIIEINNNRIFLMKKYRDKIDKFVDGGLNFDFLNQAFINFKDEI
ncbi:MAG: hypothetical protein A2046_15185 [Bacteroidetes bacterium GWA2_30_7]|nr:MAG: hypothetical protein A2046_15185 [Bacteroidetes bacterium GWA2_30_7]